ncbi:sugar-transfer associated ATP-grasp domain-containing protein [Natronolimnohabitans sp. A-GB9]|uniref:sugar-transfer associated ATP-grasp domain-containing protein n=1 Tax=Natronolimnohabitans sp. A-GB9 TaxID=3069757 RepID=UPI0027B0D7CF|nr:sugar-transfer associated ATP-grasp domain-containing protein [Natronolimnohabitans sp. A-GB9]MDQ2051238.1 sugar-transfer associated ATP-grasp domain-containing protein [Natronolimnohabitans sp. A-GB9]
MMSLQNGAVGSATERFGRIQSVLASVFAKYAPLVGLLAVVAVLGVEFRYRLDFAQQPLEPYRVFFELLIAGLVVAVLRSKVGLVTYGMFGPIIISFILVESGIFWGLVLFTNVFLIALATYLVIEPFRLGTAHRIGALVMVVSIGITSFHVMSDTGVLPAQVDALQVFFPAIVTAWYADRFARELSERDWRAPAIRFSWTVVAIVIAAAIIGNEALITWFMETPETWALVLAANVYFGTRSNMRVKEYLRFSNVYRGSRLSAAGSTIRAGLHNAWARLNQLVGRDVSRVEPTTVMSMQRRNRLIKEYNPPHLYPEIDKASMKRTFHGTGVSTPETYALVGSLDELETAQSIIDGRDEFVIKPDSGYGGEGIVVVTGRNEDGTFETSTGDKTPDELLGHVRSIVEGQYDPMGLEGVAVIEGLIHPDDHLLSIAGQGVPDIRVIVFKGFPIMAMTRLPTEESDGAANLHMGAVGVGLDVANGQAQGGYQSTNKWFDEHPDTGVDLEAFAIPGWAEILSTAVKAAEVSRLGYTGVDIVVDEDEGPMVLEINARPGLGIQNSTFDGLLERTTFIESLPDSFDLKPPAEKIELARQWDAAGWDEDATELAEQWETPEWERSRDDVELAMREDGVSEARTDESDGRSADDAGSATTGVSDR